MSDRYPAQIRIGGQVSRTAKSKSYPDETVFEALLGAIAASGVSSEYGDAPVEPNAENALLDLVEDGWLRLCDDQAVNGEIPELEEFCREEGIPYNRNCCAYGGYPGEDVTWLPGMKKPLTILETDDGHEQVDGAEVRRALVLLRQYIDWVINSVGIETQTSRVATAARDSAMQLLERLCPEQLVVPKFEVMP